MGAWREDIRYPTMSSNALLNRTRRTRAGRGPRERRGNPTIQKIVSEPLDVDTFLYVFHVFDAAATRMMPSTLGTQRGPRSRGNGFNLTDHPINRGMLAAFKELKSLKLPELKRNAYLWRVMDVAHLFDCIDRLDGFVERSLGGDELVLSEAIVKALAVASYDLRSGDAKINIDSLIEHARRFKDQEAEWRL
jgi:hypothetical protein